MAFKAKVAIEILKEKVTIQQIAPRYEVHPTQVSFGKCQFLGGTQQAFGEHDGDENKRLKSELDQLYRKIGKLEIEKDFLKKV
ncbi:hypothetical protein [Reichenbachiella faecimaris]|uniref:hypothetical protein n=1 Tax=Reichenbachiella faecimaris TaxID=692418 RepID=UPI000A03F6C0|nr:hypothetical protein [Reichenbachiella faecimaris]